MLFENTQTIDLTQLLRPYENKWVAIDEDYSSVLASANTFHELQQLTSKITGKYVVFKVLPFDVSYIPRGE